MSYQLAMHVLATLTYVVANHKYVILFCTPSLLGIKSVTTKLSKKAAVKLFDHIAFI